MCMASQIPGTPATIAVEAAAGGRSLEENTKGTLGVGKLYTLLNPEFPDPVAPQGPARQEASPTSITGGGLRKKRKAAAAAAAPEEATESFSGLQIF